MSETGLVSVREAATLRKKLLAWYRSGHRPLPWRQSRDVYRVWVSEAMLQQTRVETVLSYWERFVERLPTLADLAASSEEEVLALWSGLGYYSRARRLREAAIAICERHGGEFPRTRGEARALPGVGPYTAGAVLSIAYGLAEPLVDGNVARVFTRLRGLELEPAAPRAQRVLWELAEELVPKRGGAGDWNQALMELGATVCTPTSPRCSTCPVARECVAHAQGREEQLPLKKPKVAPLEVSLEIACATRGGEVLLALRPPGGRMAGLLEPPTRELPNDADQLSGLYPADFSAPAVLSLGDSLGLLRHSITRHRIQAEVREARVVGPLPEGWRWVRRDELGETGLTGMAKKVLGL
jgi:A/G-specific adenine glycosylase